MTDEQKPAPTRGVPVELDRTRRLRYPLGVLHGYTGEGDVGTALADLLHRGLKHEDPDLTVEEVGEIVDLEMIPNLIEPLRKATGGLANVEALFGLNGDKPAGKAKVRAADG